MGHLTDMPVPMTSIQYVQQRLVEAVETSQERSPNEQSELLSRLLAIAYAASKDNVVAV